MDGTNAPEEGRRGGQKRRERRRGAAEERVSLVPGALTMFFARGIFAQLGDKSLLAQMPFRPVPNDMPPAKATRRCLRV